MTEPRVSDRLRVLLELYVQARLLASRTGDDEADDVLHEARSALFRALQKLEEKT